MIPVEDIFKLSIKDGASTFTFADKKNAIERELKYRRRVYPRLIAAGKMTDGLADTQIKLFEAILDDYVKAAASERLI